MTTRQTVLNLVIFLMIFVCCHGNTGDSYSKRNDLFTPDTSLDGYECGDDFEIKVSKDVTFETISKCARLCSEYFECVGFFYQSDKNKCVLCNNLFNPAGTESLGEMKESKYFSRSECNGWLRSDKEVRVFTDPVTRHEAQSICESTGGSLVKIKDTAMMRKLTHVLTSCPRYNHDGYWTDGLYDASTGVWTFSDGTPLHMDQTDYWEWMMPDQNDQCTRLRYNIVEHNYRWNDYQCDALYRFICEY